ncbi:MAG: L-ribulose-5-phosphate 4-epimerase AraD [Lentisphaerae bacterium]|jgi:L-ribulose-5-phosphate 4-epimerase|nr:L-ribulose-5-phosphate 4-epimerase AraD [Lentisphaerota bacterium]
MKLKSLREEVWRANLQLEKDGLIFRTWGNVSGLDSTSGILAIKPSGVPYSELSAESMVLVDLEGTVVDSSLKPSSDLPTHLALYRAWAGLGGVAHTHSTYATAFAQAQRAIPCLGTTHADYFYGEILCTRKLTDDEIGQDYEVNTGHVIVETYADNGIAPKDRPGVLVASHGSFAWGANATEAADNAAYLEMIAKLASETLGLKSNVKPISQSLLDKHFLRKHGPEAYYGQTPSTEIRTPIEL